MLYTVIFDPYEIIYYLYFTDLKQICDMFKKPYNIYRYPILGTTTPYLFLKMFRIYTM